MRTQDVYKNVGRPPLRAVPVRPRTQKDTKMKLLYVFAALLALCSAEGEKDYDDMVAAESIELQKTDLKPEASASAYASYPWNQPQKQTWTQPQTWPQQPQPQPPQTQPGYFPPPSSSYVPEFNPGPVQSDYVHPPVYHPHHPTTTPVAVIKNEQSIGENGSYKYEYKIADGTWVGEEGYFVGPQKDQNLVKKGWYQYIGADKKTYTVTYWADHTGYHAYGDHLPTPPPIPPAIQASIEQNAKEEAAKAEAEKNKPYHPTQKPIYYDPPQQPQQIYYPTTQKPIYYDPPQQPQQTYYPTTQKPIYYDPPQQPQQTYYPSTQKPIYNDPPQQPQQTYYPTTQKPIYNDPPQQPQQPYYPPQQPNYPQNNYPQNNYPQNNYPQTNYPSGK